MTQTNHTIFGTPVFNGTAAKGGYALNAMCFAFNEAENRQAFAEDEEAFMARFDLPEEQRQMVRDRDVNALIAAGGNVYYLAKLAGIFGLGVQDLGAIQTGVTVDEFKAKLLSHGATEQYVLNEGVAA